ncbi:MAG: GatB/YqeY domain-containing protein [bacterium]
MSIKEALQADLKTSMIARDSFKTDVIKGLKSAIMYAEIAAGKRDTGLTDEEILTVFKKESKKRQESADMYISGNRAEKAEIELKEKLIIDGYLPAQLDETALNLLIDNAVKQMGIDAVTKQDMGKIIGAVKAKGGAEVDGAMLAKLVQARIQA